MTDETDPGLPAARPDAATQPAAADPSQAWDPGTESTDPAAAPTDPAAAPPPALPSVSSAQVTAAWAKLGPIGQLVAGGSLAAIVIVVLGALIGAWDSNAFLLLVLVGGIAGAVVAWITAGAETSARPSSLPLASIELAAGAVVAVLAVWRLIELIFDLDQLDAFGGAVGAVLTAALAAAGVAMLLGAVRRDPSVRTAVTSGDQGTRIAVGGLALVLIGWALNLSIGDWRMVAATPSLAFATFGVVVIVVAPRWAEVLPGIPVAWVGAGFGIVVALLAIDQFGALGRLGIRTELGLTDYVPFLVYVLGIVAIIAGGILAGMPTWQARPKAPAPAVVTPPTTAPTAPAASAAPVSPTAPVATAEPATPDAPATTSEPPAPPA
jgi:hypothetical protein